MRCKKAVLNTKTSGKMHRIPVAVNAAYGYEDKLNLPTELFAEKKANNILLLYLFMCNTPCRQRKTTEVRPMLLKLTVLSCFSWREIEIRSTKTTT